MCRASLASVAGASLIVSRCSMWCSTWLALLGSLIRFYAIFSISRLERRFGALSPLWEPSSAPWSSLDSSSLPIPPSAGMNSGEGSGDSSGSMEFSAA